MSAALKAICLEALSAIRLEALKAICPGRWRSFRGAERFAGFSTRPRRMSSVCLR